MTYTIARAKSPSSANNSATAVFRCGSEKPPSSTIFMRHDDLVACLVPSRSIGAVCNVHSAKTSVTSSMLYRHQPPLNQDLEALAGLIRSAHLTYRRLLSSIAQFVAAFKACTAFGSCVRNRIPSFRQTSGTRRHSIDAVSKLNETDAPSVVRPSVVRQPGGRRECVIALLRQGGRKRQV
jgi:hypothetical protein